MKHIRETHRHFEGAVRCGIDGCPSTRKSYESLRQHIYSKHKDVLKSSDPLVQRPCEAQSNSPTPSEELNELSMDNDCLDSNCCQSSAGELPTVEYHSCLAAAQFILKTRDGRKITQTTLDGILSDTRGFIEQTVAVLEDQVKKKLEELNELSSEEIREVLSPFSMPIVKDPFKGLDTLYKQERFFQEHFNYVVSKYS